MLKTGEVLICLQMFITHLCGGVPLITNFGIVFLALEICIVIVGKLISGVN